MAKVTTEAKKTLGLSKREGINLRLAALLHDIGHYPYSHLMEGVDRVLLTEDYVQTPDATPQKTINADRSSYPSHESLGELIVTTQRDLIKAIGNKTRAKEVANLFTKETVKPELTKLITSSLDLDRLDYLIRDSNACGVPYGRIDLNYLLNCLRVSKSGTVGILEKALPAVEHFLLARFYMHRTVYYHKTTYGIEEVCRQLLRRVREKVEYDIAINGDEIKNIVTSSKVISFTDSYVDQIVQQAIDDPEPVIQAYAKSIQSRIPPKLVKEVLVWDKKDNQCHPGAFFREKCKDNLNLLAQKYNIPLGQFLLCTPKQLIFEKGQSRFSTSQFDEMSEDDIKGHKREDTEIIRVFKEGQENEEPVPIVEIDHSLITKCAELAFKTYRLYVVYNGTDRKEKLQQIQNEVAAWDKPS